MQNPRFHGTPPYKIAVAHGGPGARGSAWPIAHALGRTVGTLEPMQTAMSIDGQVEELRDAITENCETPVVLIGHSWGAWLAFILAARHPALVKKLILICSGPFEARYAAGITATRLGRLSAADAAEARAIMAKLGGASADGKDAIIARFGALIAQADAYSPAPPGEPFEAETDAEANARIWEEAAALRENGGLLALAGGIQCPVAAIHGDYDPHPWRGVREPLEAALRDFRMILIEKCGHEPWNERYARDRFFAVLREEAAG